MKIPFCSVRCISNSWENISFKVGNEIKTSFWNDVWIGDRDLKTSFPDLFYSESTIDGTDSFDF